MAHQVAAFILSQGRRNFCLNKSGREFRGWSEVTPALHHPACRGKHKCCTQQKAGATSQNRPLLMDRILTQRQNPKQIATLLQEQR